LSSEENKYDKALIIIAVIFAIWGIVWLPGVSYAMMMILFAIYSKISGGK